ncbi:hypothetical protein [Streptomyces sp. NPDC015125]|uniref:hypothetical protein n=1 Tax=Streptomyces sp. NPDC015125 TaxID=3364938 RepID=UPI00370027F3
MTTNEAETAGDLAQRALSARPESLRVTALGLGELLGISSRTIYNYASAHGAESPDPFPASDGDGRREWAAVRSWLLRRNDPFPGPGTDGRRDWQVMRSWLLRHAGTIRRKAPAEADRDEHGLPLGQRDVLERVLIANRAGEAIPALWIAEVLVLEDTDEVEMLLEQIPAQAGPAGRLRIASLARELGIPLETLKFWAKTFAAGEDPFPATDEHKSRNVAEVRAWADRRRMKRKPK